MTTTLVIVTDGRAEYLVQCVRSLGLLRGKIDRVLMVDDSGDRKYAERLDLHFPRWDIVHHPHRQGLAATVRDAWSRVDSDWLFHLEEDFVFQRPVVIDELREALEVVPQLAQMCLVRQPWSPEEVGRGGIPAFMAGEQLQAGRFPYVAQRDIFSLNPCLIPADVFRKGWPDENEAGFTQSLAGEGWWFGYWGAKDADPAVTHIGVARSSGWKL